MRPKYVVRGFAIFLTLIIADGPGAVAQQTPGTQRPKQSAPATPPEAAIAPATSAAPQVQIPSNQLYGNWMFSCEQAVCQAYLSLSDSKTNEPKLSWAFIYDATKAKISTVLQVPTMVALPPGVRVYLDEKTTLTWPFQFCDKTTCRAIAVVSDSEFASLKRREQVVAQFFEYGRSKPVSYQIPMGGLAAATDRLITEAKTAR